MSCKYSHQSLIRSHRNPALFEFWRYIHGGWKVWKLIYLSIAGEYFAFSCHTNDLYICTHTHTVSILPNVVQAMVVYFGGLISSNFFACFCQIEITSVPPDQSNLITVWWVPLTKKKPVGFYFDQQKIKANWARSYLINSQSIGWLDGFASTDLA